MRSKDELVTDSGFFIQSVAFPLFLFIECPFCFSIKWPFSVLTVQLHGNALVSCNVLTEMIVVILRLISLDPLEKFCSPVWFKKCTIQNRNDNC